MSNYNPYNDGTGYGKLSSDGHMNGSNLGGFSQNGSDSQSGGKPQYATQFIVPVSIKMLNDATISGGNDSPYYSHGIELSYVRFVGVIREVDIQKAFTLYKIEDGTGSISFRSWNNSSDSQMNADDDMFPDMNEQDDDKEDDFFKSPQFNANDYVQVTATVKDFNEKIQVQAQSMQKIDNYNNVIYHLLNIGANYLISKNDGLLPNQKSANAADSNNNNNSNNSTPQISMKARLLEFVKVNSQVMNEGIPIQFAAQELGISLDDAELLFTELVADGDVFSAADDNNYLPL